MAAPGTCSTQEMPADTDTPETPGWQHPTASGSCPPCPIQEQGLRGGGVRTAILELFPEGDISPKTMICSPAATWCGQQSPTDPQGKDSPRAPLSPSNTLCHAPIRDRALQG